MLNAEEMPMDKISPIKVIFIDDDSDYLALVEKLLKPVYPNMQVCLNPEEALNRISIEKHDLVVCDYQMPTMLGSTLVAHLRVNGYFNPIIFLTAELDLDLALLALRIGASDILEKHVNKYELIKTIDRVVEMEKIRKNIYLSADEDEVKKNKRIYGLFQKIALKNY